MIVIGVWLTCPPANPTATTPRSSGWERNLLLTIPTFMLAVVGGIKSATGIGELCDDVDVDR